MQSTTPQRLRAARPRAPAQDEEDDGGDGDDDDQAVTQTGEHEATSNNNIQLQTYKLLHKIHDFLFTNAILNGHGDPGQHLGGAPGAGHLSSVTDGLSPEILRGCANNVFVRVSAYFRIEHILVEVADTQSIDIVKKGNKAILRAAIISAGFPTSNNVRSTFLKNLLLKLDCAPAHYLESLDEYVSTLGDDIVSINVEQMTDYAENDEFTDDNLFAAVRAAQGLLKPVPAHGIKYIPSNLLAYCLVALAMRKNLVSSLLVDIREFLYS